MTPKFGPELLGQTEKTLQAILHRALADTGLDERLMVALRVAEQNSDGRALRDVLADRARFEDADELVTTLEQRGLVANNALTSEGQARLEQVLAKSAELSGPIWEDIDDADAAARALTVLLERARAVLQRIA